MLHLKKKDLLRVSDLSSQEIVALFNLAAELKNRFRRGERVIPLLAGKSLALLFEKPSTRTRVSFEVAMQQLGGHSLDLPVGNLQVSRGETIADTARVLSGYLNGLVVRTYQQETVERLAAAASIPVINGLTNQHHPCQALSDFFTIWEKRGGLKDLQVAYFGDGNNVCCSLMQTAALLNVEMLVVTPPSSKPDKAVLDGLKNNHRLILTTDPAVDLSRAEVLYTDVWVSMGEEKSEKVLDPFQPYQLNRQLVKRAANGVMVMHCLPAHRGWEITDEVLDGPHSIVWEQAENRLHFQKSLLAALL